MFSVSLHLFYSCVKYSVLIYDPLRASTALENVATPLYHNNRDTESKHNTKLLGRKKLPHRKTDRGKYIVFYGDFWELRHNAS